MPTLNADAGGEISVTLEFRYLEKKLVEITQKLDAIMQKLDNIEAKISDLEKKCGGGGAIGAAPRPRSGSGNVIG